MTDGQEVEMGHDGDMEMVDAAQVTPASGRKKKQAAVNAEPHLSDQNYVEIFKGLLLSADVTSSYNLGLVVCTIKQSVFNSEHIGADKENTRRFGHISLKENELKGAISEAANADEDDE